MHDTHDIAWIRNDKVDFADDGSRVLEVDVPRGGTVRTGMKVFERVYSASNPTSVTGRIRATNNVTVDFLLQRRRPDDALGDALENGPSKLVGRVRVPEGSWQAFSFDFDQPRVSTRSVRLLIDVRSDDEAATVGLDDLAWIEWSTPWLDGGAGQRDAAFATHVQFQP